MTFDLGYETPAEEKGEEEEQEEEKKEEEQKEEKKEEAYRQSRPGPEMRARSSLDDTEKLCYRLQ